MSRRFGPAFLALAFLALVSACERTPAERNDAGAQAEATRPDLRVVTLAPHLAEIAFAVGAGDHVVGVSSYTDRPPEAAALPVVSDAFTVDHERIAMLDPDLLLAWGGGMPGHVIDDLRARGFRVETIETRSLDDVAVAIERVGALTGREEQATRVAEEFRAGLRRLAERYRDAPPIDVFYQVSRDPLYTVSAGQYMSDLIEICGGRNVFDDLGRLAPMVDVEAVLSRNPEVMLASEDNPPDVFDVWKRWPALAANRYGNYFFLPAGDIGRASPRLVQAGEKLCAVLEEARERRALIEQ